MAQKIVVQDGIITYSASDPTESVDFTIKGQTNITKQLNVGDDIFADGLITTQNGVDLEISTTSSGNLKFTPGGSILLKNVAWPNGTVTPTPGVFIGSSATNVLQYYQFIVATSLSDNLTQSELNSDYPDTQAGQSVLGPTVIYFCAGGGTWRKCVSASSSTLFTSVTSLVYNSASSIIALELPANATILNIQVVIDQTFTGTPEISIGISGNITKYSSTSDVNLLSIAETTFVINPGKLPIGFDETINIYYASNSAVTGAARIIISYYSGV
jgi:hypothetical protein